MDDVEQKEEDNNGEDLHLVFAGGAGHIEDHRPAEARSGTWNKVTMVTMININDLEYQWWSSEPSQTWGRSSWK